MDVQFYDEGTLVLQRVDSMTLWYTIDRAVHANVTGFRPIEGGGMELFCSSRISDADIEGTLEEMLDLAKMIQKRGLYGARRCAVECKGDRAELWSPRNSDVRGSVPLNIADDLADQIFREAGRHG